MSFLITAETETLLIELKQLLQDAYMFCGQFMILSWQFFLCLVLGKVPRTHLHQEFTWEKVIRSLEEERAG